MKDKSDLQKHYDEQWSFSSGTVLLKNLERASIIISMLPKDAQSVMEVGCGDGLIINQIDWIPAIGVDVSEQALRKIKRPALIASADEIPVPDRAWDAVIASEVLEHLPEDIFERSIYEITRVARRFIVISVPNKENLSKNLTRCPRCGFVFNSSYHFRSFSPEDMPSLFPGFLLKNLIEAGEPIRVPPKLELFLRYRVLKRYLPFENKTCLNCGFTSFGKNPTGSTNKRGPSFFAFLRKIYLRAPLIHRQPPRWIFAVYERA